jgi:hypothetical protein
VNVDALAPARLFNRELLVARRPAAGGPRGMGWMDRIGEQHGLDLAPKFYPVMSSFLAVVLPNWAGEATGSGAELFRLRSA